MARWAIVALLVAAATAKLVDFDEAIASIDQTNLLPVRGQRAFLAALISVEILAALLLTLSRSRWLYLGLGALFAAFAGYSALRFRLGLHVPCSCFGAFVKMPAWASFLLSTAICQVSFGIFWKQKPYTENLS
ncbi:MAG: hypothetical protein CNCCGFBP_00068 [Fimbriimonadaceae bacterium]|nr:hypothetical protein [Fimbriimonadaceae bacterium]